VQSPAADRPARAGNRQRPCGWCGAKGGERRKPSQSPSRLRGLVEGAQRQRLGVGHSNETEGYLATQHFHQTQGTLRLSVVGFPYGGPAYANLGCVGKWFCQGRCIVRSFLLKPELNRLVFNYPNVKNLCMTTESKSTKTGNAIRTSIVAIFGAVVGALVTSFLQNGHVNVVPADISYPDLAAILLSAVGVIVAIFGGVLAIAAFWGFEQMKREAVRGASQAALGELKEQIENGATKDYILGEIKRLTDAEFASRRMDRKIQERIDMMAMGRSEDRLLADVPEEALQDEAEEGEA
jgi:hypothetical protein